MGRVTETKQTHCPHCGAPINCAGFHPLEPHPRPPQPGDLTICLACAGVCIFTDDLDIRAATKSDDVPVEALDAQADVRRFHAWRASQQN